MKLFIINGYGLDAQMSCIETYAIVCISMEDAERQLNLIIEEQRYIAKGETFCGVEYYETLRKRNGQIQSYTLEMLYDIRNPAQKESFLSGTLVIQGNIALDEFLPVLDESSRPEIRVMKQASISIKELEVL